MASVPCALGATAIDETSSVARIVLQQMLHARGDRVVGEIGEDPVDTQLVERQVLVRAPLLPLSPGRCVQVVMVSSRSRRESGLQDQDRQ
jgi:hypothetical protein